MANNKATLTITVPKSTLEELRKIIGAGKISNFATQAIEKALKEERKIITASYRLEKKDKKALNEEMKD